MLQINSKILYCGTALLFFALLIPSGFASNHSNAPDKTPTSHILSESVQTLVNEGLTYYKRRDFNNAQEIFHSEVRNSLLKTLFILGVSAASIFPDLDSLAKDLKFEIEGLINKDRA